MKTPINKRIVSIRDDKEFLASYANNLEIPIGNHPGSFGYLRKHHAHEGIDLYCEPNEPVHAIMDGVVLALGPFTGKLVNSHWWNDTDYLMVEHDDFNINYGEIKICEDIKVGSCIYEGQTIGHVARVLKIDKGRPLHMLHLEMYLKGTQNPSMEWVGKKPIELLDPTEFILKLVTLGPY